MNQSSPEHADSCIYEIDANDRIVFCNDEWDRFARNNGGDDVVFQKIKGKLLWSYFGDLSSEDLYRRLVSQVRNGRQVNFSLRCDSPEVSRLLEMSIAITDLGRVRFTTRVKLLEQRKPDSLNAPETGKPLLVCSWCGRVNVENQIWQDVDVAVGQMGIFERSYAPAVSHGICPDCYRNITDILGTVD